jgi:hypothetical protein
MQCKPHYEHSEYLVPDQFNTVAVPASAPLRKGLSIWDALHGESTLAFEHRISISMSLDVINATTATLLSEFV